MTHQIILTERPDAVVKISLEVSAGVSISDHHSIVSTPDPASINWAAREVVP